MEQLEKFLKSKRAFSKFNRNLKKPFKEHTREHGKETVIISGFIWSDTPEGLEYWGKINDEWIS